MERIFEQANAVGEKLLVFMSLAFQTKLVFLEDMTVSVALPNKKEMPAAKYLSGSRGESVHFVA